MYPDRLLPSKDRVNNFNYSTENDWICRRSGVKKSMMYDDDGNLEDTNIKVEDIIGCSTNLINSPSTSNVVIAMPSDVLISVEGTHRKLAFKEWNGNNDDVPSAEDIDCNSEEDLGYFFIPINSLHEETFEFPFDNSKGVNTQFELVVRIIYKPTMINVSHFEICLFTNLNGEMKEVKFTGVSIKGYRAEVCHIVKELINRNWKLDI
jgi:hypothetical protein